MAQYDRIVFEDTRHEVSVEDQEGVMITFITDTGGGEPHVNVDVYTKYLYKDRNPEVKLHELHVNELAELIAGLIKLRDKAITAALACYNPEGQEQLKATIKEWDFGNPKMKKEPEEE